MKYANLHLHSTYSDAQFTPEQLVLIGKSLGYRALALTDHETDGGVKSLMHYAEEEGGIDVIPGIEFYGKHDGVTLHIVALDYDMDDSGIRALVKERVDLYNEYTRRCVERGIALGYVEGITWDDVLRQCDEGTWICIDTVFNTYRAKRIPIPEDLRKNVFKAPEMLAIKPHSPSAERVIRTIRAAGGIAAVAHPNGQVHYVKELVAFGLNGIEVDHPDLTGDTPRLALEAAEAYGLYRCGGTDHTGPMSGCGGENAVPTFAGITEEEYCILKERRLG